jgi:hypothetical protein
LARRGFPEPQHFGGLAYGYRLELDLNLTVVLFSLGAECKVKGTPAVQWNPATYLGEALALIFPYGNKILLTLESCQVSVIKEVYIEGVALNFFDESFETFARFEV